MIEINLLSGPKRKKAPAAGISLPNFGEMFASVRDPLLLAAVGGWAVALTVIALIFTYESRRQAVLRDDLAQVETEARRFQGLINQKRREERLRDSLLAQLDAIRSIDADRYNWPHIMEEVTKALPDYTWLEGLAVLPSLAADTAEGPTIRFLVDGRTADMGGYTRFLRQLGASPWISSIVPGPTRAVVENDKAVFSFTVTATFRRASSAYIRTVPVIQSIQ